MADPPPPLPAHLSANGSEIWGWAHALSEWQQRQAKIARLRVEIAEVTCGDCDHWMKSRSCPREHNVNGRSRGPSMYGTICPKFIEKSSTAALRQKRRDELAELLSPTPDKAPSDA